MQRNPHSYQIATGYRTFYSLSLIYQPITKKRLFFKKKSVKAGYSAMLTMKSSKFNYKNTVFCPYGKEVSILNLPIERVGNVFDAVVENFKSSRGDAKGNQSFHNIRVI